MTVIYIISAGAVGIILGIIIELFAERPYIESLEQENERLKQELEEKNRAEVIDIKPEENPFRPF